MKLFFAILILSFVILEIGALDRGPSRPARTKEDKTEAIVAKMEKTFKVCAKIISKVEKKGEDLSVVLSKIRSCVSY
jgi:hypothetical protein